MFGGASFLRPDTDHEGPASEAPLWTAAMHVCMYIYTLYIYIYIYIYVYIRSYMYRILHMYIIENICM